MAQFEVAETDKDVQDQKLIIKQISLGADAKSGEFNVVQVIIQIHVMNSPCFFFLIVFCPPTSGLFKTL